MLHVAADALPPAIPIIRLTLEKCEQLTLALSALRGVLTYEIDPAHGEAL